jgi:hypothetical protein
LLTVREREKLAACVLLCRAGLKNVSAFQAGDLERATAMLPSEHANRAKQHESPEGALRSALRAFGKKVG